jgi:hypothetical protein
VSVTSGTRSPDDDEPIVQVSTTSAASRTSTAFASFAAAYAGSDARWSQFGTDGQTVKGAVDGRPTEPASIGADVRTTKFKGGQAIAIPAAPGQDPTGVTRQAVRTLMQQIRSEAGSCVADPKAPKEIATCTTCQLTCRAAYVPCSVSAIHASLELGGLAPTSYLAVASATCDNALQRCLQTCKSSGACCPDFCKGDAACCRSSWGCCPPSVSGDSSAPTWPTCTRCGTPPWAAAPAATTTPIRRKPTPKH